MSKIILRMKGGKREKKTRTGTKENKITNPELKYGILILSQRGVQSVEHGVGNCLDLKTKNRLGRNRNGWNNGCSQKPYNTRNFKFIISNWRPVTPRSLYRGTGCTSLEPALHARFPVPRHRLHTLEPPFYARLPVPRHMLHTPWSRPFTLGSLCRGTGCTPVEPPLHTLFSVLRHRLHTSGVGPSRSIPCAAAQAVHPWSCPFILGSLWRGTGCTSLQLALRTRIPVARHRLHTAGTSHSDPCGAAQAAHLWSRPFTLSSLCRGTSCTPQEPPLHPRFPVPRHRLHTPWSRPCCEYTALKQAPAKF
ncbi:hypothetical protein AVEN_255876-1 [Araneus ventricosus]|uniref:Uncharacterized protein n=1 Tax=Araneus ventricosus TaxID=182803 RepID=A0A4Y2DG35_ARAVE|nr:hypothetical protein AVEN_255876-1 [Araneus ventricosus]